MLRLRSADPINVMLPKACEFLCCRAPRATRRIHGLPLLPSATGEITFTTSNGKLGSKPPTLLSILAKEDMSADVGAETADTAEDDVVRLEILPL